MHPADAEALFTALADLKRAGNSLFVVEHDVSLMRRADWIVDVGPHAGELGGRILYSGPPQGLPQQLESITGRYLDEKPRIRTQPARQASAWLRVEDVTRNNVRGLSLDLPLGVMTAVTGVSGSGKSSLVSQALVELLSDHLGYMPQASDEADDEPVATSDEHRRGRIVSGGDRIRRLVTVDQKPIGRTPRSNLATYTGLFDNVRQLFAASPAARAKRWGPARFSFNVVGGRCPTCEGSGSVSVELLFMPSAYSPCPTCHGKRYQEPTLAVQVRGKSIADVLAMTVDGACAFFADEVAIRRPLELLREIGVGYLRLGQPATELSGGEAQRVKLAAELQRAQRGDTVYVLDEPTTGLHPADVDRLLLHLGKLVDAGNTVVMVEHDLQTIAASDWVIDLGPGAGEQGGKLVVAGTPKDIRHHPTSKTGQFLARMWEAGESH